MLKLRVTNLLVAALFMLTGGAFAQGAVGARNTATKILTI